MAKTSSLRIVIIGAGLQGLSVAACLAKAGLSCTVLESQAEPMCGASQGNEGKIHLGLVYAMDRTGATGRAMLEGALSFSGLLDSWLGALPWANWRSEGFKYAVMPGSLAQPPELELRYEALRCDMNEMLKQRNHSGTYLGEDLTWLWRRAKDSRGTPQVAGASVPCFETQEKSIDSRLFAPELIKRVAQLPHVELLCLHRVQAVQRQGDEFELQVMCAQGEKALRADVVINCAWSDRVRLDETVGMKNTPQNLSYRVKHRVIVQPIHSQHDLCPVTMVQGPYGDVLPYADGTVYLSWYPLCRTHFDTMPPHSMVSDTQLLADVSHQTVQAMSEMFPALQNARVLCASPCVIVAPGQQDVDDPLSQLHQRNQSGPEHEAGWWSVDTGKLTLAPLHAKQVLEQVREYAGVE